MAGLHDQVVVLLGYVLAILIPCGTIYKMYVASLRNKKSVKEILERQEETDRRSAVNSDRLQRIEASLEKFQEKITVAVEKLADRVYDNKK